MAFVCPNPWAVHDLNLTLALVLEEIAAGDGGVSTTISVTNCPVNAILMRYGNDAQKQKWLTRLAQGELLGAFCLTEAACGLGCVSLAYHGHARKGDADAINWREAIHHQWQAWRCGHRHCRHRQKVQAKKA